jgi:uncharacterized protein (DUF488 family)
MLLTYGHGTETAERTAAILGAAGVASVVAEAGQRLVAVLCSESQWRTCHRQLLADFSAVARGVEVRHLRHDGRTEAHRLSAGLRRRDDGLLVYDAGQTTLI